MEENGSIPKVDFGNVSAETSAAEVSAEVQPVAETSTTVPTAGYEQAKERLQRFDLVIQHLHRLRATLALDSSVRELQKLQTLNILGQSLMQPNTRHTHNATGHHPPMPLLPPPPPPPPGAPGLRPPGAPPPPMASMMPTAEDILVKLGMKRKKKWTMENPTKKTNWKAVPAQKLTKDAFWTKVDEERLASESLINNLVNKFGTKPVAKNVETLENGVQNGVNKKKTKELKVLDPRAAQNLSILLGGALKHTLEYVIAVPME